MKAIVYERYGPPDVLELREVEKPVIAGNELLVRVHASSVNAGDWRMLTANPWIVRLFGGLLKPKRRVLGWDVSGTVEAVGANVTQFKPGDVFGESGSAFAEFASVSADQVVTKPAGVTHEAAAAAPTAALTALQGLCDKGRIQSGHKVLIIGASGGVGTYAVQIARSFGAEVTAAASAGKLDLLRSIGADHAVEYGQAYTHDAYDLILDNVGDRSLAECRRALAPGGTYVSASSPLMRLLWMSIAGGRRMVGMLAQANQKDLRAIAGLLESGDVTSVVDRTFPLKDTAEAIRYVMDRRVRGKVVIVM